jgi:hypothetical protein
MCWQAGRNHTTIFVIFVGVLMAALSLLALAALVSGDMLALMLRWISSAERLGCCTSLPQWEAW